MQLPGREGRISEPPESSIVRLGERLVGPLARRAGDLPYVLFGHSLGALVAYELTLALQDGPNPPAALVVSACAPPHLPRPDVILHRLPDEEFRAHVELLGGIPPELLGDEEWLELFLPLLRTDFEAAETYHPQGRTSVVPPLIAIGGTDDPAAPPATVERWRELGAEVTVQIFEGGHFFAFEQVERAEQVEQMNRVEQLLALVPPRCWVK